jgi:hypothetical protein
MGQAPEPSQAAVLCRHAVSTVGSAGGGGAADVDAGATASSAPPLPAGRCVGATGVLWALSALRELPGWRDPFLPAQWEALADGAVLGGGRPSGGARREQAGRPCGGTMMADAATGLEAIARLSSGQAAVLCPGAAARCARELLRQAVQAARRDPRRTLQSPGALAAAAAVLRRSAALGAWDAGAFDALAGAMAAALEAAQARAAAAEQPLAALPPAPALAHVALALCEVGRRDERLLRLLLQALGSLLATEARVGLGQAVDVCYAAAALQAPPSLAPLVQGLCQAVVLRRQGGGGSGAGAPLLPVETLRRLHAVHAWAAAAGAATMGGAHGGGLRGFLPPEVLRRCCQEAGPHGALPLPVPLPAVDASGCESGDDDPLPPAHGCGHGRGGASDGGQCGGSSCDSSSAGGSGGGGPPSGLSSGRSSTPRPCSPPVMEAGADGVELAPATSAQGDGAWQSWCDAGPGGCVPESCWQWQGRPEEPQAEGHQEPDCQAQAGDGGKRAPSRAAAAGSDAARAEDQRSSGGHWAGGDEQPDAGWHPGRSADEPGCVEPSHHQQQQQQQQQPRAQQHSQPTTPPPPQPVQHHIAAATAAAAGGGGGCPIHSRALSLGAASSSNWSSAGGDAAHSRSASLGWVQTATHARRPSQGSAAASSVPGSPPPPPPPSDEAARRPAGAAGRAAGWS